MVQRIEADKLQIHVVVVYLSVELLADDCVGDLTRQSMDVILGLELQQLLSKVVYVTQKISAVLFRLRIDKQIL